MRDRESILINARWQSLRRSVSDMDAAQIRAWISDLHAVATEGGVAWRQLAQAIAKQDREEREKVNDAEVQGA